jgi:hypothetical protein
LNYQRDIAVVQFSHQIFQKGLNNDPETKSSRQKSTPRSPLLSIIYGTSSRGRRFNPQHAYT